MSGIRSSLLGIVTVDKDAAEMAEATGCYDNVGFFDADPGSDTGRWAYLGADDAWQELSKNHDLRILMAADPPALKNMLIARFYGFEILATVIAASASVSRSAHVGVGCLVQEAVTLFPDVVLGRVCKINHGATLHHDVKVGDFCTIAPGARLLGRVEVGQNSYIGSGATLLPRVRIGENVKVGSGAVVIRDLPSNVTVVGVPAKIVTTTFTS